VADPILTARALNRALLARQLLLERSTLSIPDAVDQIGGLQTQYAPSGYVGLWTRLAGFERSSLTRALEDRTVIQATLMRVTIHVVSRREYWLYALGVRQARREQWRRTAGRLTGAGEEEMQAAADRIRAALADGPRSVKELGDLATGFVGTLGLWVDLVRVPPAGTWERRRADRLALAEDWVGPSAATEADGLAHLVRAYLRAFGPGAWRDIASWTGISITTAREAARSLDLRSFRGEDGGQLVDLPDAPLPDPDTPAPVRFLPHWDANLLVHARRTGLLPEPYRPLVFSTRNPFSVGTYLVDGVVAGAWSLKDGRVVLDPFEKLTARDERAVEREREALEAFHA
jgi:winged helix DNA-binding protein